MRRRRHAARLTLFVCLTLCLAGGRAAGAGPAQHLTRSPRLLGDPGGARARLEARGVIADAFFNHQTGVLLRDETAGDVAQSGSVDLYLRGDLARLGLRGGGLALLHAKSTYNRNLNRDAGALGDPIDDADGQEPIFVAQLFVERALLDGRLRARAGYLDQQVAFDRNAYANSEDQQFLNAFLDNGATVPLEVGIGAMLVVEPLRGVELALAAADADNPGRRPGFDSAFDGADSLTSYAELTLRGEPLRGLPGALRVGAFRDGARRAVFGRGRRRRGHFGAYLSVDQRLLGGAGGERELGLFARAGLADARVSRIRAFWSAGLEAAGPVPGREADALGLAAWQTLPSRQLRDRVDPGAARETGVELYYAIRLAPWLTLTPDAQWIHQPGGSDRGRDAFVLALRWRVAL